VWERARIVYGIMRHNRQCLLKELIKLNLSYETVLRYLKREEGFFLRS